jgi:hypothetical protein
MKSLLGKLGVFLIGLAIFGNTEVWGADWKQWTRFGDYYDVESITRPSKNIVRVWTKHVFLEEAVRKRMKNGGKIAGNEDVLDCQLILYEIDCAQRMARQLSVSTYSMSGKFLAGYSDVILKDWFLIEPESMAEVLLKAVCK